LLEAVNLECVRGDRSLFRALSFTLQPGALLHLLGRNGAGKTTLLRTLCGLTHPAAGEIRWQGEDARDLGDDYRRVIAYVGHANGLHGELTAVENLMLEPSLSANSARDAAERALTQVGLVAYRNFPAKILSQGQKRRLALARLLIADKPLWILDEPFSALDVSSVETMIRLLDAHLARGGLVVLTSHQELTLDLRTLTHLHLDA
jgi:heme exporter protein A